MRRRLDFDTGTGAVAGGAGHRIEGADGITDAGTEFQGVKAAIEGDGQSARVLEAVAELRAFGVKPAEIAKSRALLHAAQADAASLAADKPAVGKIVTRLESTAADIAAAKV